MDEPLFPSGPWVGFYNYPDRKDRHRMDLNLTFHEGALTGDGNDDIGLFLIRGEYDVPSRECSWKKSYVDAHAVSYRGFREGKGIWGTWEVDRRNHGGFHIWPRGVRGADPQAAAAEQEEQVDAVASEVPAAPAGETLP